MAVLSVKKDQKHQSRSPSWPGGSWWHRGPREQALCGLVRPGLGASTSCAHPILLAKAGHRPCRAKGGKVGSTSGGEGLQSHPSQGDPEKVPGKPSHPVLSQAGAPLPGLLPLTELPSAAGGRLFPPLSAHTSVLISLTPLTMLIKGIAPIRRIGLGFLRPPLCREPRHLMDH